MVGYTRVPPIAGMKPWLCSYDGPDGRYSITLYGTNPKQVLNDNSEALSGLVVDGELDGYVDGPEQPHDP